MSVVILPIYPWRQARAVWQRAEQLGCHAAYTYDHLSWRQFRDGPWFGALPTLTAAATATSSLRLGTMVTSPNFRQPVTLAKDLMTLDDISEGRLTVGIGAGGAGFDATVLGNDPWPAAERAERFAEFVTLTDELLRQPVTDRDGRYYSAHQARMVPGTVQRPRPPFLLAANGPRGMQLAARYGQGWVSTADDPTVQLDRLAAVCDAAGQDPARLQKVLLTGFGAEDPPTSLAAVVDRAGHYQQLGIGELVVHWPIPDSQFALGERLFEQIITEVPRQLGG